jgi:preprotein translocase subunit SecF
MEDYAVDNLDITIFGAGIHAQGTTAIAAAFIIAVLLVSLRFRK